MGKIPYMCGKNRMKLPTSGCDDCSGLEYRIDKLEDWVAEFEEEGYNALANKPSINGVTVEGDKTSEEYLITAIDISTIDSLTPIECFVPECQAPIVCSAQVCCAILECSEEPANTTCNAKTCSSKVACGAIPQCSESALGTVVSTFTTVAHDLVE